MAKEIANIDFQDLFLHIWDKYSDKTFIKHESINVDTILFAFEKAMYKFIYIILGRDSFIFWDDNYAPIVYFANIDNHQQVYINKFNFNFARKTYNLFLKMFVAELKKQILLSSADILLKDFPNRLAAGTIAEVKETHSIVIIDDIYNKYNNHIVGILELANQPIREKPFYRENKKLFFYIRSVQKVNYSKKLFLTRTNRKLVSSLIKSQMTAAIEKFQVFKKRAPVIACVKRVPNGYSIVVSDLFIPKHILDITSKNLFKENIYVVNPKDLPR